MRKRAPDKLCRRSGGHADRRREYAGLRKKRAAAGRIAHGLAAIIKAMRFAEWGCAIEFAPGLKLDAIHDRAELRHDPTSGAFKMLLMPGACVPGKGKRRR